MHVFYTRDKDHKRGVQNRSIDVSAFCWNCVTFNSRCAFWICNILIYMEWNAIRGLGSIMYDLHVRLGFILQVSFFTEFCLLEIRKSILLINNAFHIALVWSLIFTFIVFLMKLLHVLVSKIIVSLGENFILCIFSIIKLMAII